MDTGDCQTNMLANRDAEITALRARVAELEAVRNDLQSGLRTLWREYVITDSGSMSLAELIARGQRMKRFELKYGNALSSCPPLASVTTAAIAAEGELEE